jgi:diguanylate cyclase (GGDEF)-like protein
VALRNLFKFFFPGALILLAAVAFIQLDFFQKWYNPVMHFYPYTVYLVGILLGWRFNRSRLLFAIIVLVISDRILAHFPLLMERFQGNNHLIVNVLSVLLPLNLILLSVIQERGILTIRGIGRLGLIFIQPVIVYTLILDNDIRIFKVLNHQFFNISGSTAAHLTQPILLIFFLSAIFLIVRFILKSGVMDSGFFWALLAAFLALTVRSPGSHSTFYFATAGLILVISVLEASYMMAFRDELTGLPGRRALQETFLKLASSYTLAMVDIDHFKKLNDRHGHDVGDQVLRMVASRLAKVGGGGKVFRYGGEEFTIVFFGRSVKETFKIADNLRRTIAKNPFVIRSKKRPRKKPENLKSVPRSEKKVTIKVSIGMAERCDRYPTPQEVMKAADKALYRAKNSGRNCIRTAGSSSR